MKILVEFIKLISLGILFNKTNKKSVMLFHFIEAIQYGSFVTAALAS